MEYEQILEYIFSIKSFNGPPTLERIKKIMNYLGNPQNELKFVHIAGTNGKGSIASYVAESLIANGYKTGKFISPFIIDFRERIQINNEMIPKQKIIMYAKMIIDAENSISVKLTQFEFITAMALKYYSDSCCDIVVLEVGLGGRFDATNVIPRPEVAAIASISLDHTAVLGTTESEIAWEKAGIIKKHGKVVCYPVQPQGVLEVISLKCKQENCKLFLPNKDEIKNQICNIKENSFDYKNIHYSLKLIGKHQLLNCITAIDVLDVLRSQGFNLEEDKCTLAINDTTFPCRLEKFSGDDTIIIDGAHNPDAAEKLKESLVEFNIDNIVAVVGFMKDKNWKSIIQKMKPLVSKFIAVDMNMPRGLKKEEIISYCSDIGICCEGTNCAESAVELMKKKDKKIGLVFGSLYLAAKVRDILV